MKAKWWKQRGLKKSQRRHKLQKKSRKVPRSETRSKQCVRLGTIISLLLLFAFVLVEQSGSLLNFEVYYLPSTLLDDTESISKAASLDSTHNEHDIVHSSSPHPTPFSGTVVSTSSKLLPPTLQTTTTTTTTTMKPNPNQYSKEKKLLYIPSDKLQEKDYFSGSFLVSRQTFLQQLKPRHFTKLESATLELVVARNRKKAKMLVDWTALCVEHFSHWWKTMYGILEYIHNNNENNSHTEGEIMEHQEQQQRAWMQRIVEIFLQYIQETAPRQLQLHLEYHNEQQQQIMGENSNDGANIKVEQEYPMQRTIAAIAFQPYRLPKRRRSGRPAPSTLSSQQEQQQQQLQQQLEELLTVHSLAATIASMVAVGFGRIVVVGYQTQQPLEEVPSVQKAFALVQKAFPSGTILVEQEEEEEKRTMDGSSTTTTTTTTKTLLGYVTITDETWVRNYRRKKLFNLQMGVVTGLQTALKGRYNNNNIMKQQQQQWLGKMEDFVPQNYHDTTNSSTNNNNTTTSMIHEHWKYVFLTEPDLLLHTKPWVLPLLAKGMEQDDESLSFFPHRLQPLPHQADFANLLSRMENNNSRLQEDDDDDRSSLYSYLLPKDDHILPFSNITTLLDAASSSSSSSISSCCDEIASLSSLSNTDNDNDQQQYYPGRATEFGWRHHQVPCEDWWWTCGYLPNRGKVPKDSIENNATAAKNNHTHHQYHLRLARYHMMRLQGGSGVVFGSTEQGRRCIPQKGPCM